MCKYFCHRHMSACKRRRPRDCHRNMSQENMFQRRRVTRLCGKRLCITVIVYQKICCSALQWLCITRSVAARCSDCVSEDLLQCVAVIVYHMIMCPATIKRLCIKRRLVFFKGTVHFVDSIQSCALNTIRLYEMSFDTYQHALDTICMHIYIYMYTCCICVRRHLLPHIVQRLCGCNTDTYIYIVWLQHIYIYIQTSFAPQPLHDVSSVFWHDIKYDIKHDIKYDVKRGSCPPNIRQHLTN